MAVAHRNLVAKLTWDEVAARIEAGAAAVLPIGAGAKEHGFHLPMETDRIQADWLAGVATDAVDALVWPTLTYGFYPAFVHYAGSVSLAQETFSNSVQDIIRGLAAHNVGTVLVINTGISTLQPVDDAITMSGHADIAHHLRVHEGPRYRAAADRLRDQAEGTHADELETARMLALAPDAVKMARATASPPGKGGAKGPLTPHDPKSANYSPSGSWGDPTLATREKGQALIEAMAADVAEMARKAVSR
ncbi:MAG: creatininase family protein [Hyphomicrobiaceae bacterium]|nr:creatininase family protein [Hyphomicrobiaceae bacterium]